MVLNVSYNREDIKVHALNFEDIEVGLKKELRHTITAADVDNFARLTGDYNPLHIDEEFAKTTSFRKPIVHGMLTSSFISTMIGTLIPGKGALWTSQSLDFLQPAFYGDEITVVAEVTQKSISTRFIKLEVKVYNQNNHVLVQGQSKVKLLESKQTGKKKMINRNTVLVTGASRGIGASIAIELAKNGYPVIINYSNSEEAAHEVVSAIKAEGGKAIALKADVADLSSVKTTIATGEKELGPITSLIHCAAPNAIPQKFSEITWEYMEKHFNTQVKGAYNCVKELLPAMEEHKTGSIIFIGSIFAEGIPPIKQAAYSTSKAALGALARTLAVEYGPKGIRVNIIAPGMTETDMIANLPERSKMMAKMQTPLRKLGDPQDIADIALFLTSEKATHITGQTIKVCGGIVM